jgi:membrane protease subunit (stomatin/prohibitin family)
MYIPTGMSNIKITDYGLFLDIVLTNRSDVGVTELKQYLHFRPTALASTF